ncbi:MAG: PAS domain S-box protein [Candidatus Aminicenantes bacterium]|nr:PAS domain S-box protein [Candidatus Aminicenantes bacterium]
MKADKREISSSENQTRAPDTILIVEDDEGLNRLIAKHLEREGFKTISVTTGKEAVSEASQNQDILLLLDFKLQDMTGKQVLEKLDQAGINLPFVVMTGFGDEEIAVDLMKRGAIDYIVKSEGFIQLIPQKMKRAAEEVENKIKLEQAQEALKVSEALFRTIVETSPDEITMADLEGRIQKISRKTLQMHGFDKKEEIIGKSALDLIAPEHHPQAIKNMQKTLENGYVPNVEYTFLRKDGTTFPGELSSSLIQDKDGTPQGFIAVTRDITERKKSEEKIKHLNLVLNAIRNVNRLIVKEKNRKKLIQKACRSLTQSRGYSSSWIALFDKKEELIDFASSGLGNHSRKLKEQFERGKLNECAQRALKQEGMVFIDDPQKTCKECPLLGTEPRNKTLTRRLEHNDKIFGILSVSVPELWTADQKEQNLFEEMAHDLAFSLHTIEAEKKRKLAEQKLKESEEFNRSIIENSKDCIKILDLDGNLKFMSKGGQALLEIEDIGPFLNKSWFDLWKDEDNQKARKAVEKAKKGEISYFEGFFPTNKGKPKLWGVQISPIRDADGKVDKLLSVSRDISKQKNVLEQIQKALKEKNVMLQEIHHRVKNNMQIISSLLNLQSQRVTDKKTLESFRICRDRIKAMALIHESLYESQDLAEVDFASYVKKMTTHLFAANRSLSEQVNLKMDVENIFLDINKAIPVGLIINELVSNSFKHGFPGKKKGSVSIKMKAEEKDTCTLVIADTGVGLPKEYDWKNPTTLGIQLVTDLVKQIDGTLDFHCQKGTRVQIKF